MLCCPHCFSGDFYDDASRLPWEDEERKQLTCSDCGKEVWVLAYETINHKAFKTEEELEDD